jgi:hypothetical protein
MANNPKMRIYLTVLGSFIWTATDNRFNRKMELILVVRQPTRNLPHSEHLSFCPYGAAIFVLKTKRLMIGRPHT